VIDAQPNSPQNYQTGEIRAKTARKLGMPPEPNAFEQAVARALRDNLERIQRSSDELNQAVNDVVAACSSTRPTNALPPMLRAQSGAASLAASLEVLARFITLALNPAPRSPLEERITQAIETEAPEAPAAPARPVTPAPQPHAAARGPHTETPAVQQFTPEPEPAPVELEPAVESVAATVESNGEFDINRLTTEEQELHRRANRVAKVSMQDIKMLRPEQVKLGRENRDICIRLKDDIEKAHREYDRRFKPIMDHPVDYFYRWMVEILAEGDASALGEYPYATTSKVR
jgi:hypothetical protein